MTWDFREYMSADGKLPVSIWYRKLTEINQARADRFLSIVQKLDRLEMPHFRKFKELIEARWVGENKVPHRIFCYVVPDGRRVVFLCGCTHKDKQYKPRNAYKTALKRRGEIVKGEAGTHAFDF